MFNRNSGLYALFAKSIDYLEFYNDEKAFIESFVLRYVLDEKINKYIDENLKGCDISGETESLGLRNYAIAVNLKIAEKDLIYKKILEIEDTDKEARYTSVTMYASLLGGIKSFARTIGPATS